MSVTTSHPIQGLKLLDGKVAVIYGAAGGVGAAVAKAFAREGAAVFLTGRTENSLKPVAKDISSTSGVADVFKVDALSPESVEAHLHRVVTKAGGSTFPSTSLEQTSQWARS
jgi:short-subunit dehydrogenase